MTASTINGSDTTACGVGGRIIIPAQRRPRRRVMVGGVPVGGGAPVSVQSMTNTDTRDAAATLAQIGRLTAAGCEIVRVAVPDMDAARALGEIVSASEIPVIADIHFDWRLAMEAMNAGIHGLRINPGNIGSPKKVRAVGDEAAARGIPVRIGVNAGSLEKAVLKKYGGATAEGMVESALGHCALLENIGFTDIKISLKASDVPRTVAAYRMLTDRCDYPLHVGVTEAGGLIPGAVKSALGIGMLLAEGIGDTIRVSLTRDPVEEVRVGYEILKSLGLRQRGPEIISCPTCGRCRIDLFPIAREVEEALLTCDKPVKVAVMGCAVNGPGEAKEADVGIAGGDGQGILFKKGKVVRRVPQGKLVAALLKEIDDFDSCASKENNE